MTAPRVDTVVHGGQVVTATDVLDAAVAIRGESIAAIGPPDLLPPAVARAIDHAVRGREQGPILRNTTGRRMDRHAATRRLKKLSETAGIRMPRMHPHMLRHTFVTTM